MHTINTDLATGIIEIEVEGFWDRDHVADFARDLNVAARAIAATGRRHTSLYDYSRAAIQTQQVVAALQQLAEHAEHKSRRVALYTGGQLARLQAKRIAAVRDDIAVFDDRGAALAWLMAG